MVLTELYASRWFACGLAGSMHVNLGRFKQHCEHIHCEYVAASLLCGFLLDTVLSGGGGRCRVCCLMSGHWWGYNQFLAVHEGSSCNCQ